MSFNIMDCLKNGGELPPQLVNYMYANGAFMVLKEYPEGQEFGIDYKSWTVGPKFMGLKMIPPGVHFIFCSVKKMPRIGFFHYFEPREVMLKEWDHSKEDFREEKTDEEQIARLRASLQALDGNLGPYPYENYRSWYALTDYITKETVERLRPKKGLITAQAELISMETELQEDEKLGQAGSHSQRVDRENPTRTRFVDSNGLPVMKIREGYGIRFQPIPQMPANAQRAGIDHSDELDELIRRLGGDWKQALAECQYAFACFLVGQVFEGFEQWKRLIHIFCCCPSSLTKRPELFLGVLRMLFFQLKECPSDFFVDIVSKDNFLTTTLSMLFANIRDSETCSAELKRKSLSFKQFLSKQFKWDFECD